MRTRPVVGLVCDHRVVDQFPAHSVLEMYLTAVRDAVDAVPFLIPSLDPPLDPADVLSRVDGLLFPGSVSNVSPSLYGGHAARDPSQLDERRDGTSMALMRAAAAAGAPILTICRGTQELNVALGGTLHQHVHEVPGRLDHRFRADLPEDEQWGPMHAVTVSPEGVLARITQTRRFDVNSLHEQGIDKLAPALHADAVAPDGQIEAVSMAKAGFVLGLQWHPEWRWADNDVSRAIFGTFAQAIRRT